MILERLREWATRLRWFLFRREQREVGEELQFHIEEQIQANCAAGMDEAEARRQALIVFGGVENSREACARQRPTWLIETLLQDVRYWFRGLRRNPAYSITAILT
jgi:putative ABC transport system permease protein